MKKSLYFVLPALFVLILVLVFVFGDRRIVRLQGLEVEMKWLEGNTLNVHFGGKPPEDHLFYVYWGTKDDPDFPVMLDSFSSYDLEGYAARNIMVYYDKTRSLLPERFEILVLRIPRKNRFAADSEEMQEIESMNRKLESGMMRIDEISGYLTHHAMTGGESGSARIIPGDVGDNSSISEERKSDGLIKTLWYKLPGVKKASRIDYIY